MKHLGQTKERKQALTMGLRIMVTKSVKTLRMTRLRLALRRARNRGWANNKYTFRKVSQIVFSQGYKCKMHVFLQASANMLSQKLGNN